MAMEEPVKKINRSQIVLFSFMLIAVFIISCQRQSIIKNIENKDNKSINVIEKIITRVFSYHNFNTVENKEIDGKIVVLFQKDRSKHMMPRPEFKSLIPLNFSSGKYVYVEIMKTMKAISLNFQFDAEAIGTSPPLELNSMIIAITKEINEGQTLPPLGSDREKGLNK
jgi:hypothetical protein